MCLTGYPQRLVLGHFIWRSHRAPHVKGGRTCLGAEQGESSVPAHLEAQKWKYLRQRLEYLKNPGEELGGESSDPVGLGLIEEICQETCVSTLDLGPAVTPTLDHLCLLFCQQQVDKCSQVSNFSSHLQRRKSTLTRRNWLAVSTISSASRGQRQCPDHLCIPYV